MGGETSITARKAEVLGKGLFEEFLWKSTGSWNHQWPCEDKKAHETDSHPTDAVYYYDEPYRKIRTFVNIDLKSYAAPSIKPSEIKKATESLAKAISCADKSESWKNEHVHSEINFDVIGLLFVYNHDGNYDDTKFSDAVESIKNEKLNLAPGRRLFILGPKQIDWLNNVRADIVALRGVTPAVIPAREYCKFFYPNLILRKNIQQQKATAASLEMLTGPWILLEYDDRKGRTGIVIYYNRSGSREDEFVYLLDYLEYFQYVHAGKKIIIKTFKADKLAPAYFKKAKQKYLETFGTAELEELLNNIEFKNINDIQTKFCDVELGME